MEDGPELNTAVVLALLFEILQWIRCGMAREISRRYRVKPAICGLMRTERRGNARFRFQRQRCVLSSGIRRIHLGDPQSIVATPTPKNALDRIEGRYAGPNTKLGISVVSVWHITDHYGQLVEYLRMNGIVPPMTQKYGLKIR